MHAQRQRIIIRRPTKQSRLHVHTYIITHIKIKQLGINIRIYHTQPIQPHRDDYTQLLVAAKKILARSQRIGETRPLLLCPQTRVGVVTIRLERKPPVRLRVRVRKVVIRILIVTILRVIPIESIPASQKTTIHNRQFPPFAVIYLPTSGEKRIFDCPRGYGLKLTFLLPRRRQKGVRHIQRVPKRHHSLLRCHRNSQKSSKQSQNIPLQTTIFHGAKLVLYFELSKFLTIIFVFFLKKMRLFDLYQLHFN